MSSVPVRHEPDASRFVVTLGDQVAECQYILHRGSRRLDIVHTEVPPAGKGQGIAAALVQAALDWARQQGWRVRPSCSYAASYMRKHPDTHDLLEDGERLD